MLAAAHQGDAHAVAAWLYKGGDVDARSSTECMGATLLIAAAAGGHEALVRMLLQRGASINLLDSLGRTVLMAAAANGHTTTVQALLDAKADAFLQSENGRTALTVAEHFKCTAAAQVLRQHVSSVQFILAKKLGKPTRHVHRDLVWQARAEPIQHMHT